MAWRKRSSASPHAHAVETDITDFALELADLVDAVAHALAQAFDLAGGEAHFQQFGSDGVAVLDVFGVAAAVAVERGVHFGIAFFNLLEVLDYLRFELFQIGAFDAAGIFAVFFVFRI